MVGLSLGGVCHFTAGGILLRGSGLCVMGESGPPSGGREVRGRVCGAGFLCGGSTLLFARGGVHV